MFLVGLLTGRAEFHEALPGKRGAVIPLRFTALVQDAGVVKAVLERV